MTRAAAFAALLLVFGGCAKKKSASGGGGNPPQPAVASGGGGGGVIAGAVPAASAASPATIDAGLLRYVSFAVRDQPPSVQEANDFASGSKDIGAFITAWLQTPAHATRIQRYFDDMFGVSQSNAAQLVSVEFYLNKNSLGIYKSSVKSDCDHSTSVFKPAWWLEPGQTIEICPTSTSDQIQYPGATCSRLGATGIQNAQCGCGPSQILCYPGEHLAEIANAVKYEFRDRGLYAYQNGLSWTELFAGNFFIGDRWLYHRYIHTQSLMPAVAMPTAADLANLAALPLGAAGKVDFPTLPAGSPATSARAPVVTAPGFLLQYNNFRSRVRALTQKLLCHDVDASLNTDGIATLENTTLSAFDKAHGTQANCSVCHYGMDNMGSTLLRWDVNSNFLFFDNHKDNGHVFGQDGNGPAFLMTSFVERGPGFQTCMASRAWEDFSGGTFGDLPADSQAAFVNAAGNGPQALIQSILASKELQALRTNTTAIAASGGGTLDFAADVKPVLAASCSGGACHSQGTSLGTTYAFIDDGATFKKQPVARLNDRSMPPAGSGKSLSDADRALLVQYLGQ